MDPVLNEWVKKEGVLLRKESTFGVYRLQPRTVHDDTKNKVRVLALGPENDLEVKSVLLLGETGAGKTLFLNAILNRIFGVGLEDDVRLHLKDQMDAEEKSTTKSQTEYTTAYTIYHQDGMLHRCNFMIIDTPGFGDTEGMDNRQCIRFYLADETWISHLNSVGVFFKVTDNRYTKEKKEIVQNIKDLLGFDIKCLIDIMVTFSSKSDTKDTVNVIGKAGLPCDNVFPFDNVYINLSVPEDERDIILLKYQWEEMTKNQDKYLDSLTKRKPMSLNITQNLIHSILVAEDTERKLGKLDTEKQEEQGTLSKLKIRISQLLQEANEVDMSKVDEMRNSGREIKTDNNTHGHFCSTCKKVCLVECSSNHQSSLWNKQGVNTKTGLLGKIKGLRQKFANNVSTEKSVLTVGITGIVGGVIAFGIISASPFSGAVALGAAVVEGAGWVTMLSSVFANITVLVKRIINDNITQVMHRNDGEKECPHCGHWGLDHYIIKQFELKDASVEMLVELLKKEQFQKVCGKKKDIESDISKIKEKLEEIEAEESQAREMKEKAEKEKKLLRDGPTSSDDGI